MPLVVIDGPTIAAGESLSDGADCSAGTIVRITVPQEYTKGNMPHQMSFQVSTDGNLYNDLFDDAGQEISITARENSGIVISGLWAHTIGFIKLRSGFRGTPVRQEVACKFALAILTE
jgi:hypothetical protein